MSGEYMQNNIAQATCSIQTEQQNKIHKSNWCFHTSQASDNRQHGELQYTARDYVHKSDWPLAMSSCFLWRCDRWYSCVCLMAGYSRHGKLSQRK